MIVFPQIVRAPDEGAAAAAAGADAGAAAVATGAAAADTGAAGAGAADAGSLAAAAKAAETSAAYYPEGLPEDLRGKTDQETIDKISKHLGALPKPPETADAYALEVKGAIDGIIDPATDKVLPIFRQVAHEHGLTNQQFQGVIEGFYGKLSEAGLLKSSVDVTKEFVALGGPNGDPSSQRQRGQERIATLTTEISGLATRGHISQAQAETLSHMAMRADQVIAMEALIKALPKAEGLGAGGSAGAAGDGVPESESALRRMYPSMHPTTVQ